MKSLIPLQRAKQQWFFLPIVFITISLGWKYSVLGWSVPVVMLAGIMGSLFNGRYGKCQPTFVAITAAGPLATKGMDPSTPQPSEIDRKEKSNQIIAYYFHANARCQSCLLIEKYSHAAIMNKFDSQLKDGTIIWQVINLDEPANQHFIQDYQLQTKSLVISLIKNGKEEKWKNLDKVWEYLRDEPKFQAYVTNEVSGYIGELPR